MTPDLDERLTALWKRFDSFPEVRFEPGGGAVLGRDAYVAFLDARKLVDAARQELRGVMRHWRDIAEFFTAEIDGPAVLLWARLPETGEPGVTLGYWDGGSRAWYREREGPDLESPPLAPAKWMPVSDLMLPSGLK